MRYIFSLCILMSACSSTIDNSFNAWRKRTIPGGPRTFTGEGGVQATMSCGFDPATDGKSIDTKDMRGKIYLEGFQRTTMMEFYAHFQKTPVSWVCVSDITTIEFKEGVDPRAEKYPCDAIMGICSGERED
jgi:hypothetical protein